MTEVNKAIMVLHSLIECPKISASTRRSLEEQLLGLVAIMVQKVVDED